MDWTDLGNMLPEAILGAIVGGLFSGAVWVVIKVAAWLVAIMPVRLLLRDFRGNDVKCFVLVRRMNCKGGTLVSLEPDCFPPHTTGTVQKWQNIPWVYSEACVRAATDAVSLLGQVGKVRNIEFASPEQVWDQWSFPMILAGGTPKFQRLLESAANAPVKLVNNTEYFIPSLSVTLQAYLPNDYGLIWKKTYPPTGKRFLVLAGLGTSGTAGAGHYLREHARLLAMAFGNHDFAVMVRTRFNQGTQSATPVWCTRPVWYFKLFHPLKWHQVVKGWVKGKDLPKGQLSRAPQDQMMFTPPPPESPDFLSEDDGEGV